MNQDVQADRMLRRHLSLIAVGPVPIGVNSFDFTCAPPNPSLLPSTSSEEILGVTVLILTASYRDKEFVRVGYYVNTEYEDEPRRLEPPAIVDFTGLIRNVLVEKPRVTRFNNPWDSETKNPWGGSSGETGATGDNQAGGSGSMGSHLDAPINVGSNEDARANVFNSPLPPPVVAAAPAVAPSGSVPHQQSSTSASATPSAADVDMS